MSKNTKSENRLLAAILGAGLMVASGIVYLGSVVVEQRSEIASIKLELVKQQKTLATIMGERRGHQVAGR